VFQIPLDQTPREYCTNPDNLWYNGGEVKQVNTCAKVPNEWIIDAVEVYSTAYKEGSNKRLTADIDAGYVWLTHQHGHSLCRNIDQQATEASGHTVYQDTNNSTNDFYERKQCSLKD
jgi:hypothetical protein